MLFVLVVMLFLFSGYMGIGFLIVVFVISFWWLLMVLCGYRFDINVEGWVKCVFGFFIVNIMLLFVVMLLDYYMLVMSLFVFLF